MPTSMMNNDNYIDEERAHDYGEGAPDTTKIVRALRVSALPHHIQESARRLDTNNDGALSTDEIADAISDLDKKERKNRNLKITVQGIIALCVLLIAAIFASSVAAATLSKDFKVDHANGFAYVKGSHDIMSTSEAIVWEQGTPIADMSNDELAELSMLLINDGNIRFDIRGFARNTNDDTIILMTEGGTLTYNFEGIIYSTGQARAMLEAVFGEDLHVEGSEGQRNLWCLCSADATEVGKKKCRNRNAETTSE